MGRRFTSASSERIHIGSTAALTGFNFNYGTMAVCCYFHTLAAAQVLIGSNDQSGANIIWFGIDNAAGNLVSWWNNSSAAVNSTAVTSGTPMLVVASKATGSVNPRFSLYTFGTNTWVHEAGSVTTPNSANITALTLGAADSSGSNPLNADVWAIGMWPNWAMTDGEVKRLAHGSWLDLSPALYEQWSDGREQGDMVRTLGRNRVRQTARTGTTRGTVAPPPGFRMDARRRRS